MAAHTHLREPDVEEFLKYFELIDEQSNFITPEPFAVEENEFPMPSSKSAKPGLGSSWKPVL